MTKINNSSLGFLALLLLQSCATAPPVQEMSDARQAIAAAREAGADELAPATLVLAEQALAAAELQLQNGIYRAARRSALNARESAFDALLESRHPRRHEAESGSAP